MTDSTSGPLRKPSRSIAPNTRLFLYVQAGGRCEFDGCNSYLLEHYPTFTPGNFAEMAHIWAFSPDGPRGHAGVDPADLNSISNLILLCPPCHKLIDDCPDRFPVDIVRKFKRAHEDRVFMLTDTRPDRRTVALVLKANIGRHPVEISLDAIQRAISPLYLNPRDTVEIDLTRIADQGTAAFYEVATAQIGTMVRRLYEVPPGGEPRTHVSVFALAPIPLLTFLGTCLSNKISTALFQRHRDTEDWTWKDQPSQASFSFHTHRRSSEASEAALLLSLSGRVHLEDLRDCVDETFSVYEIALSSQDPNPRFLNSLGDLEEFRALYARALRQITSENPRLTALSVFPAIPAPIAVAIGRDLLPKRDPTLIIFDYDKSAGGFRRTLEVNPHDA